MWPVALAGLGYYLPPRRLASAELETQFGLPAGWCERATGIRERRRAERGETTVGMAAQAARMALAHADCNGDDIDLILGASTGPQQLIPCTAALVQREMGLPDGRSFCLDVNATCLSFLAALHTAAQFVASGAYRRVLIFSSEITRDTLSPHEPESAVLMGDGAAAAVLERSDDAGRAIWHTHFATHSSGADLAAYPGAGTLHPPFEADTTRDMYYFHMNGPALFRMAGRLLPPFVEAFLAEVGWRRGEIDAVVPHQASGPGVRLLWSRCGFRPEQVVLNLATRGNCVAAALPLALAEAVHEGRIRRGHKLLLLGTGAGVTLGATALTY